MMTEPRPPIDMTHLGTYTQGDKALELELLTMFLPSAQGYLDAMSDGQDEKWWTAAHSLKGVALGVGAWEIAALAETAEGHRDSPPAVRHDVVVKLQAVLERVRCFVADLG